MPPLAALTLAAALWCTVHSLLATPAATALCRRYRLLYNLFAALSLLPLLHFARTLAGPPVLSWPGLLRIPQLMLAAAGVFFLVAGSRQYDMPRFLGLTAAEETAGAPAPLKTGGILRLTRHPWYLAGLLLLWARDHDAAGLALATVFSFYLVIGARLEERKLITVYGERYRQYQREVSMLLPLAWLGRRLGGQTKI